MPSGIPNAVRIETGTNLKGRAPTQQSVPSYGALFRCIGPDCEDTCCKGWDIPVDSATYSHLRQLSSGSLRDDVLGLVTIASLPQSGAAFATIPRSESGMCSLLDHDMLCSIQKQLGRELLPTACSIFPRSISKVDGELEVSLSLSCPEAARNVLLDETFIDQVGDCRGGEFRVDNVFSLKRHPVSQKLGFEFSAIRRAVIGVIRDRAESLEVRLLKIGALCRNLDDVSRISDIEIALDRLAGRIPSDVFNLTRNNVSARIQLAFDLSSPHLDDPANSRFPEVFLWFAQGLSSTSPLQKISDIERFSAAAREFYTPFIISRPHILENYLINYILQTLFPFGREGSSDFFTLTAWDEYVQMVVRYVWVTTLLTGIAGHLRAGFSEAHIIQTVQSLTRSIEHYPRVLASLSEYLTMTNRDHLTGVAELLASDQ